MVAQMSLAELTTQEQPDCYALTSQDRLMPGIRLGVSALGRVEVRAINGARAYTFPADRVYSVSEGEQIIRRRKISTVREDYIFETICAVPTAVTRCYKPGTFSDYLIMTTAAGKVCSCPASAKNFFGQPCKHIEAHDSLELEAWEAQQETPEPPEYVRGFDLDERYGKTAAELETAYAREHWN